jgi:hypothetical protein
MVFRALARHGESRITKAVLISAVPPLTVQTAGNPEGLPKDVFGGFQAQVANNRSQFYRDVINAPMASAQRQRHRCRPDSAPVMREGHGRTACRVELQPGRHGPTVTLAGDAVFAAWAASRAGCACWCAHDVGEDE